MRLRAQVTLRVVFASKYQVTFLRDKNSFRDISPVPPPSSSSHICKLPIESNSSLSYFLERPLTVVLSFVVDNRD